MAPRSSPAIYRAVARCLDLRLNARISKILLSLTLDQLVIASSVGGPAFWPELVDRYLVFGEYYELSPLLVVNKIDQVGPEELESIGQLYRDQLGVSGTLHQCGNGAGADRI